MDKTTIRINTELAISIVALDVAVLIDATTVRGK